MKILVGCEFSGRVRNAFALKGHDITSCDLIPTESILLGKSKHYTGNLLDILDQNWDMLIAFPPCTHLCCSGARYFKNKVKEQKESIEFVETLWECNIPKIAIENPVGVLSTRSKLGKPTQIIQPWQFGHGETKATCLWLRNLPKLVPTNIVSGRESNILKFSPSKDRGKLRSVTYQGIADCMADTWE